MIFNYYYYYYVILIITVKVKVIFVIIDNQQLEYQICFDIIDGFCWLFSQKMVKDIFCIGVIDEELVIKNCIIIIVMKEIYHEDQGYGQFIIEPDLIY